MIIMNTTVYTVEQLETLSHKDVINDLFTLQYESGEIYTLYGFDYGEKVSKVVDSLKVICDYINSYLCFQH